MDQRKETENCASAEAKDITKLDKKSLVELCAALTDENEQLLTENERLAAEQEELSAKYRRAEKAASQANDINTLYQRLQMDFDNYRSRNREIEAKAKEDAESASALRFVPVLDSFIRAIAAENLPESDGFSLIARQLEKALSDMNVERIPSLGEKFDVLVHDAVTTLPVDDPEKDGYVCAVVSEGYRHGEKVIKHAQVIVGKYCQE